MLDLAGLDVPSEAGALIDLRAVDPDRAPSYECIRKCSSVALVSPPVRRRAYVALPGVLFGVARMIQALAPDSAAIEVFTDEGEALSWLAL